MALVVLLNQIRSIDRRRLVRRLGRVRATTMERVQPSYPAEPWFDRALIIPTSRDQHARLNHTQTRANPEYGMNIKMPATFTRHF